MKPVVLEQPTDEGRALEFTGSVDVAFDECLVVCHFLSVLVGQQIHLAAVQLLNLLLALGQLLVLTQQDDLQFEHGLVLAGQVVQQMSPFVGLLQQGVCSLAQVVCSLLSEAADILGQLAVGLFALQSSLAQLLSQLLVLSGEGGLRQFCTLHLNVSVYTKLYKFLNTAIWTIPAAEKRRRVSNSSRKIKIANSQQQRTAKSQNRLLLTLTLMHFPTRVDPSSYRSSTTTRTQAASVR